MTLAELARSLAAVGGNGGCRVLVVEDELTSRTMLSRWLEAAGYGVEAAASGEEAIQRLSRDVPEIVCLDLGLPGIGGAELLETLREQHPLIPVLILTAERDIDVVVNAVRRGALDYLVKPLDKQRVLRSVAHAWDEARRRVAAATPASSRSSPKKAILGGSPAMKAFVAELVRVTGSDVTVLIHGESGTGKELAARAIHDGSSRASGPFIALNCAAVPETLQDSEFCGHERGAFTGAVAQRKGAFELANHGTLFLDEVAELGAALQAKLLRSIQERTFRRVGGTQDISSDFRLLTATHRDLSKEVEAGRFRADLFFRLSVFELEIPALRERHGDLGLLARSFIESSAGDRPVALDPSALKAIESYAWPGNVRELENAILRALVVCQDHRIMAADLPARVRGLDATHASPRPFDSRPLATSMEDIEKRAIEEALSHTDGNVSETARRLGIGRTTAYRLIKKFGIRGAE